MRELSIEVISDVVCPWCFIGERRLVTALAARSDVTAKVTFRPFLLDPSTPREGADLRESLRKKYNVDPDKMFGRVEEAARDAGIPLDFAKVRRYPSTLAAHVLIRHAIDKGTQKAVVDALFSAYFLEGRDVSDPAILDEIAVKNGFSEGEARSLVADASELEASRDEARDYARQGVSGVPFFIFENKIAFSGAQPVSVINDVIEKALAG